MNKQNNQFSKIKLVFPIFLLITLVSCQDQFDIAESKKGLATPISKSNLSGTLITESMFDDFNYSSSSDPLLSSHNWRVRSGTGGPGIPGATWQASNITFLADPSNASNKLLRLKCSTNGKASSATQAEIVSAQDKFFEGTYAARIKFSDVPISGKDGAQTVQTFFTISPWDTSDPLYSELDFEYLCNGGWGKTGSHMWNTSWNSTTVNVTNAVKASYSGWKDLVMTVSGGQIKYYVNGVLHNTHSGIYYPRRKMFIDFNLWFINDRNPASAYVQDVDWVYFAKNTILTTTEVNAQVNANRASQTTHYDSVAP
ncbi:MAG: glycoside hydrolase family 16 protein [Bacteroidota bacterium]